RSLLRSGQCAGMPARVAEVRSKIYSRKNKIDISPLMRAERNAIRRRAVYAISVEIAQPNPLVSQRSRRSDGVTHGRLLDIARENAHLAEVRRHLSQRDNARTVNAVIVRDQNSHCHINETCGSFILA